MITMLSWLDYAIAYLYDILVKSWTREEYASYEKKV